MNKTKLLIFSAFIALFFVLIPQTKAVYFPLTCSDNYPAYCLENGSCFSQFGDQGVTFYDHCYWVSSYYPHEFMDEQTGLEFISDQLDFIQSDIMFLSNVIGFWLPFTSIMIFSMSTIYIILLKFKFFR